MKRGNKPKAPSAAAARRKGLVSGRQVANNIFSGRDAKRPQQFGRTLSRGRRGGR